MDFLDDNGKPMTRQQVIAAGMGHLLDDALAKVRKAIGRAKRGEGSADAAP